MYTSNVTTLFNLMLKYPLAAANKDSVYAIVEVFMHPHDFCTSNGVDGSFVGATKLNETARFLISKFYSPDCFIPQAYTPMDVKREVLAQLAIYDNYLNKLRSYGWILKLAKVLSFSAFLQEKLLKWHNSKILGTKLDSPDLFTVNYLGVIDGLVRSGVSVEYLVANAERIEE